MFQISMDVSLSWKTGKGAVVTVDLLLKFIKWTEVLSLLLLLLTEIVEEIYHLQR